MKLEVSQKMMLLGRLTSGDCVFILHVVRDNACVKKKYRLVAAEKKRIPVPDDPQRNVFPPVASALKQTLHDKFPGYRARDYLLFSRLVYKSAERGRGLLF